MTLKGQCHEIFDVWFFSWISFPQAPEYTIRAVSNFFENSRRYSQLKVHHRCHWHRWQMEKIFNQEKFSYFLNFSFTFKFTLRCQPSDIVLTTCPRCRWYRGWCTLTWQYLSEFSKKIETVLTVYRYSGAWGKMIHEKTWSKKSRDTVPLKDKFLYLIREIGDFSCRFTIPRYSWFKPLSRNLLQTPRLYIL